MAEFTFAPLTPASFLDRSAAVFADRTAIVDGERTFTYREMSDRCRRLTGALATMGVGHGDRVAALCTNSHVMLELHHAVPLRGAAPLRSANAGGSASRPPRPSRRSPRGSSAWPARMARPAADR